MGFANGLPGYGIHPLQDEQTLGDLLWPFVAGILKAVIENGDDYIVEGCYVLPKHTAEVQAKHPDLVKACFVGYAEMSPSAKLAEIRQYSDGYNGPEAEAWLDRFVLFSQFLREECPRHGFPYIEVRNRDVALQEAFRELLDGGTGDERAAIR